MPLILGMAIILDPRFKIEELRVFLEIIYNNNVEKIQDHTIILKFSDTII